MGFVTLSDKGGERPLSVHHPGTQHEGSGKRLATTLIWGSSPQNPEREISTVSAAQTVVFYCQPPAPWLTGPSEAGFGLILEHITFLPTSQPFPA